jgi:membrane protease YdiL (CAAX protease family)
MHDPAVTPALPPPSQTAPRPRSRPLLAWAAIVLLVAYEALGPSLRPTPAETTAKERAGETVLLLQARLLVGTARMFPQGGAASLSQLRTLNTGPLGQRFRYVVVVGELQGPAEALEALKDLDRRAAEQGVARTEKQRAVREDLGRLYADYAAHRLDAPSLGPDDRSLLREDLGWLGDLALAPEGRPHSAAREAALRPARRAAAVMLGYGVLLLLLGGVGLVGLVTLVVMLLVGWLRPRLRLRSPAHGGLYAEAFALWMLLFLGVRLAAGYLPAAAPRFLVSVAVELVGLGLALAWPVLRGVSWWRVREDVGLTLGRRPWLEPLLGVAGYLLALPLLGLGLLLATALTSLQARLKGVNPADNFGPPDVPSHPVITELARPDWWVRLEVLVLACVLAPLIEETLFRGLLFRQVREASNRFGRAVSFLASATVVSFVFAVIHPQGVVLVPGLMALAFAFSLLREWRATLVPAMLAHGINNGLLLLMNILALGG